MKIISTILSSLWKVWFYLTILIAILVLYPFILVTSFKAKWYPQFFVFARVWAWMVLILSGIWPRVKWEEKPDKKVAYILSANHTSMADIMMTLALFPNCFLFIGKKELTKFPLFGYFYRRTNILVDRKSLKSRKSVFDRSGKKIDEGIGVCIYPEGGVPKDDILLAPFKNGAFRLAVDKQIPIIPITYLDNKKLLPFTFSKGHPGVARVVVHPFLRASSTETEEVNRLKEECYNLIHLTLQKESKI